MKSRDLVEHCFSCYVFEIRNYLYYCDIEIFANIRCLVLSIFIYTSEKRKHNYFIIHYDFVNFREHWGIFLLDVK